MSTVLIDACCCGGFLIGIFSQSRNEKSGKNKIENARTRHVAPSFETSADAPRVTRVYSRAASSLYVSVGATVQKDNGPRRKGTTVLYIILFLSPAFAPSIIPTSPIIIFYFIYYASPPAGPIHHAWTIGSHRMETLICWLHVTLCPSEE